MRDDEPFFFIKKRLLHRVLVLGMEPPRLLRKPKMCPACEAEHKLARAQQEWERAGGVDLAYKY